MQVDVCYTQILHFLQDKILQASWTCVNAPIAGCSGLGALQDLAITLCKNIFSFSANLATASTTF